MPVASSQTNISTGLSQNEVNTLLKQYGYNETDEKKIPAWKMFLKKFWNLNAWMLEIVIVLSLILHHYADAAVVACVLLVNSIVVFIQDNKAADAVAALKKRLSVFVNTLRDGRWIAIPARELVPGDVIRLRRGDFVPADLQIVNGNVNIDQSSLTGESKDVLKKEPDNVYSGSVITLGEITAQVISTGERTNYGKTIKLLNTASPKSHVDEMVGKVIQWLSLIVGLLLLFAMIISVMKGISLLSILPLMVILFMNAIPVALSVMFSVSNAIGAKQLLNEGVLVTRMNAPNDAAGMDIVCVDKTGTLTLNNLSVADIFPVKGFTDQDILIYGMQASHEADRNAIDLAFMNEIRNRKIEHSPFLQKNFIPFTPEERKIEAVIQIGNNTYSVYKGAVDVILELTKTDISYNPGLRKFVDESASKGYRVIAVAKTTPDNSIQLAGIVALHDLPRPDSKDLIGELKKLGVSVIMLTGDALPIAKEIADKVGLDKPVIKASQMGNDSHIALQLEESGGVAEVYPEDKFKIVKALQEKGHIVGMTGDGVNDAPALKQAEVGIAVSNAVDVAKNAASIILTREGLQGITEPIRIGRIMFERVRIWILNKFSRTLLKIGFIVSALLFYDKYVVSTTGMLLLLLVTDFVVISVSTDQVRISSKPDRWNIPRLVKISVVQGLLMMGEALILLFIGWRYFQLDSNEGQLYTFCYITLLFFSLFSVFVVRERKHFWSSKPGVIDTTIILVDFALGIFISLIGFLELKALPFYQTLFVTGYVLVTVFLINDSVKFWMYRMFKEEK